MNFKTGDKVNVIAGKDKGKSGKILHVLRNKDKVVVEGINVVKKHQKPNATNQTGGIVEREHPIHISNIMMSDPKSGKSTRIGHEINKNGKKEYMPINILTGEAFETDYPERETNVLKKASEEELKKMLDLVMDKVKTRSEDIEKLIAKYNQTNDTKGEKHENILHE